MLNEFRQDLVSGEWVLFSTERAKKPEGHDREKLHQSIENCPFEQLKIPAGDVVSAYNNGTRIETEGKLPSDWTTLVIKNKYPALKAGLCGPIREYGLFKIAEGNGFHELVITRDHDKSFADFTNEETAEVLTAYRDRYLSISKDPCGDYIQIIHNHGPSAGASVYHNHSQILSTPILPPEVMASIRGSMDFYSKNKKKVHDILIEWELEEGKRIIYQNEKFICLCPFVSKSAYEMRIFPRLSDPCFQNITDKDIPYLADVLNVALKKLNKSLGDPDYNFFIHTSPVSGDVLVKYDFYHWHVEIVPRVSRIGAFELGTNIYINTVDPDAAAELFRNSEI